MKLATAKCHLRTVYYYQPPEFIYIITTETLSYKSIQRYVITIWRSLTKAFEGGHRVSYTESAWLLRIIHNAPKADSVTKLPARAPIIVAAIISAFLMHRSKLPLTAWFWAAHLMATHSNGMSARQLEDQLGVTYKTAWLLTQKLRRSMVDPDREPLEGVVEVDQAEIPFREASVLRTRQCRQNPRLRGRRGDRSRRQSSQAEAQARQIPRYTFWPHPPCHDRENSARSIEAFVKANVKRGTTLITDGHASYPGLTGYRHDPRIVGKMAGRMSSLPWIHRAFSLMKRWSLGTFAACAAST